MERDTIVDLLASWIVFWSKYPYETAKRLFLAQIVSSGEDPKFFNENPIFEVLGGE
jgi:hypothetical protein